MPKQRTNVRINCMGSMRPGAHNGLGDVSCSVCGATLRASNATTYCMPPHDRWVMHTPTEDEEERDPFWVETKQEGLEPR